MNDKWCHDLLGSFSYDVSAQFDTKEEAIKDGLMHHDFGYSDDSFYVGRISYYNPKIDIDHLIEEQRYAAYDECGKVAESWLEDIAEEDYNQLQMVMDVQFKAWLDYNKYNPCFYSIKDVELIELKDYKNKQKGQ